MKYVKEMLIHLIVMAVLVWTVAVMVVVVFMWFTDLVTKRMNTPAAEVSYKGENCDKHIVIDVNSKEHLILMCPSGNYLIDPVIGKP